MKQLSIENEIETLVDVPENTENIPVGIKIQELKQQLTDTDYIACKIAEGSATKDEYADIIAKRQQWRDEINRLESEVQV